MADVLKFLSESAFCKGPHALKAQKTHLLNHLVTMSLVYVILHHTFLYLLFCLCSSHCFKAGRAQLEKGDVRQPVVLTATPMGSLKLPVNLLHVLRVEVILLHCSFMFVKQTD